VQEDWIKERFCLAATCARGNDDVALLVDRAHGAFLVLVERPVPLQGSQEPFIWREAKNLTKQGSRCLATGKDRCRLEVRPLRQSFRTQGLLKRLAQVSIPEPEGRLQVSAVSCLDLS